MKHVYSALQLRWLPRPLAVLALVLASAGAALAQPATFAPVAFYGTGGSIATSVAIADVNGDGKPDLLTTNASSNTAGVLLGNGNGTFQYATTFLTGGSYPTSLAVADVNADNRPDLLTANSNSNTAGVLLGNGNGTFQPATTFGTGSYPVKIAVADVNSDGKPDLLTANSYGNTAGVLLGNGNGTFQAVATFPTGGSYPNSIAVADVNADNRPDLLTANAGNSNTAGVLLGNGDGTFQPAATFGSGGNATSLAVADVNGDSRPDLLLVNSGNSGNYTAGVLLGNGNGTFQPVATYSTGANSVPSSLAVADVNGDGKLDLLTANFNSNTAGVLLGNGNGTFQAVTTFATGANSQPNSIAVADVNGDSRPDLVTTHPYNDRVGVLLNTTGYTAPTLTSLTPSTGPVGTSVTLTGTNLTGATAVRFNGTAASSFVVTSATSITAVVAAGTTTGLVRVTTPSGTATSSIPFVVRVPPTTVADAYTTPADVTLTGNVLTNDLGTNPRAILIIRPTNGALVLNPNGTFSYQANAGFTGPDSFSYYACDPAEPLLCGNPVTVSVTVTPGRVAPTTVADTYSTLAGVTLTGNVLTNDLGTNPRAILIIRPTHGVLVLNPDGSFSYQPKAGFAGADSFLYYACNMGTPLLCGNPATVSLTVLPANTIACGAGNQAAATKPAASAPGGATVALELALTGHPNPFSDELLLSFTLPLAQAYTLAIYDAQGRLVQQLATSQAEAGQAQQLTVPTHPYAAGLYFVRLTTATSTQLLKLVKQ
jgi:hypothetical protein